MSDKAMSLADARNEAQKATAARKRLTALFDPDSFVEVGALVKNGCDGTGVITGYGLVEGSPVYAFSQDSTVRNGAVGAAHANKIKKVYELAQKTGAPVVGIYDSNGAAVDEGLDALAAYGEMLLWTNNLSGVVPQVSVVAGACAGSAALIAASADFVVMSEGAELFLTPADADSATDAANAAKSGVAHIVEKDADGKPTGYVSMAINMGNFAETYELAKKHTNEDKTWYWTAWEGVTYPVEVTFKMAEKGGYMAEYIMHDLQRTNDRADYPNLSDAEFGNFRNIATTGMGKDVLYRGSSPINPELGRNTYVDAALKQAGVNVIMNLANSPEEAEAYEGFADTYYSGQKVIYLNLGVDFSAPEFQKGLAEGLRFFAANKGTYYVHCTEGKDRAGFVSALLECLMGATYDEVVADYMVTYYNYYGVEPGTDKYNAIANSNIIKTLQNAFGVEDLSKADLQKGAKDYMKAIGLTDAEITDLMVNLGYVAPVEPVTPSKPATGDAGIVVYLGLGVMALAGGVLVAKKKEQF